MVLIGCCVPGASLMPEGEKSLPKSPAEELAVKCRALLEMGFDYTECGAGMLCSLDEAALSYLEKENAREPLKIRAVNSIFPWTFHLVSPTEEERETYRTYYHNMMTALSRAGVRYAVFGSGGARMIPDGMTKEEGLCRLEKLLRYMGEEAARFGVTIVIEPLRHAETNVFNSVREAGEMVRKVNLPGVKLLCDAFHMAEEGENVADMADYADCILHCHMAEAPYRTHPGKQDSADLSYNRRFAELLMKIGYEGGVSAECGFRDFANEAQAACDYMKKIFNR